MKEIALETEFKRRAKEASGAAAARLLSRGHSITYRERDTPPGYVIRRHPDGKIEIVKIDLAAQGIVSRP